MEEAKVHKALELQIETLPTVQAKISFSLSDHTKTTPQDPSRTDNKLQASFTKSVMMPQSDAG